MCGAKQNDGAMDASSVSRREYANVKGERVEGRRPGTSEIWKVPNNITLFCKRISLQNEGPLDATSVNTIEYAAKSGERYEARRPKDSDLLKGEGSFISETNTAVEYGPKKGERYDAKKPGSSEIWKVATTLFSLQITLSTYSEKVPWPSDRLIVTTTLMCRANGTKLDDRRTPTY